MEKMPIPYDAVIFDLDGTLTESEPGIVNCVQYALEAMGIEDFTRETLRAFIGPPLSDSFQRYFGLSEARAVEGVQIYRERYSTIGWTENSVYPGIHSLLKSLKQNGVYVAVATSKPEFFAKQIADYFDFTRFLDALIGVDMKETQHSSKADLVRRALPEQAKRAAMVGDRKFDIEGAKANSIESVGVLYGYGDREELEKAGATEIAETVSDLTELLLSGRPVAKGSFITLEGVDGCGKSTQLERLENWLMRCGHEIVRTREPGGSPVAERIRPLILDRASEGMTGLCEAYLFAASRAQHVHDTILPAIESGKTVLCDRYVDSSIAYQGAGRGLGVELIKQINFEATRNCMPDLTLVFDLEENAATGRRAKRGEPDRIELENIQFISRVRQGYQGLRKENPERIRLIDAAGTPDEVENRVKEVITGV